MKGFIRDLIPPLLLRPMRHFRKGTRAEEWEYVPEGWDLNDSKVKGWNVSEVLDVYKAKWPTFLESLEGAKPLESSPEAILPGRADLTFHNATMCFAYALTLSSRHKISLSILDWGGGIGHYYLISQALIPKLQIEYHCKDFPLLVEHGRTLFPHAYFYSDESCLNRSYDFVLASTSLHYSREWSLTLSKLAAKTAFLFVSGLPVVHRSRSYVFVQRPYQYGYNTEYLGWCLNRGQFTEAARTSGLELIREFIMGYQPTIAGAPEQCEYRAFLFRRAFE